MIQFADLFTEADAHLDDVLTAFGAVCEIAWDDATRYYKFEDKTITLTTVITDDGDYTGWQWHFSSGAGASAAGEASVEDVGEFSDQLSELLAK